MYILLHCICKSFYKIYIHFSTKDSYVLLQRLHTICYKGYVHFATKCAFLFLQSIYIFCYKIGKNCHKSPSEIYRCSHTDFETWYLSKLYLTVQFPRRSKRTMSPTRTTNRLNVIWDITALVCNNYMQIITKFCGTILTFWVLKQIVYDVTTKP